MEYRENYTSVQQTKITPLSKHAPSELINVLHIEADDIFQKYRQIANPRAFMITIGLISVATSILYVIFALNEIFIGLVVLGIMFAFTILSFSVFTAIRKTKQITRLCEELNMKYRNKGLNFVCVSRTNIEITITRYINFDVIQSPGNFQSEQIDRMLNTPLPEGSAPKSQQPAIVGSYQPQQPLQNGYQQNIYAFFNNSNNNNNNYNNNNNSNIIIEQPPAYSIYQQPYHNYSSDEGSNPLISRTSHAYGNPIRNQQQQPQQQQQQQQQQPQYQQYDYQQPSHNSIDKIDQ